MHLEQALSIALHIRSRDSNMDAGSGREGDTANLVDQMEICTSILVKRMGHYKCYAIVVSDSEHTKQLVEKWAWLPVYAVHTKPFHIDINIQESIGATRDSVLSMLVDPFILAWQDFLILSSSFGYGRLAHSVEIYATDNEIECINEK